MLSRPSLPDPLLGRSPFAATNALQLDGEDGSEEALVGLCKRWSVTSHKGVEDEQEKQWVDDTLFSKGAAAIAPVTRYMKRADQLQFPLNVL